MRAFTALKLLLQRTLTEDGPLDWLATSALPLSGTVPGRLIEKLALDEESDELLWLRRFAGRHALRVQLSAWYRDGRVGPAPRLLQFEPDGTGSQQPMRLEFRLGRQQGLVLDSGLRAGAGATAAWRRGLPGNSALNSRRFLPSSRQP